MFRLSLSIRDRDALLYCLPGRPVPAPPHPPEWGQSVLLHRSRSGALQGMSCDRSFKGQNHLKSYVLLAAGFLGYKRYRKDPATTPPLLDI